MTNSKTRKTGKTSKEGVISDNNSPLVNNAGGMDEVDVGSTVWIPNANNDGLTLDFSDIDDTEDADDEIIDDGDTSTSFSLQECMNEFRARRIRRISSSQNRQEAEKTGNSFQDASEIDLINQNLCNKEQERKFKPCKDGFCYCFTSDSGDGGGGSVGVCGAARGVHVRHSRRNKRLECKQAWVSLKQHNKSSKAQETRCQSLPPSPKVTQNSETCKFETGKKGHNQITAISRLETSEKDAPLIHIIQELRDNCVISEVRVNKHKIHAAKRENTSNGHTPQVTYNNATNKIHFKDDALPKKKSAKFRGNATFKSTLESHTPTAPPLERISELDTLHASEGVVSSLLDDSINKTKYSVEPRRNAGGLLLQKRLSNAHFNYKPRDLREPPPKPPRSSLSFEDKSTTSTTSSVQQAERVVDDFLVKRGFIMKSTAAKEKNLHALSAKHIKQHKINENDKRKSYPLSPKELKKDEKKVNPTYPSLSDLERVVESKKPTHYEKNIRRMAENQSKVISVGWNEANINDMLNYDSNVKSKEFRSVLTKAQPQHRSGHDDGCLQDRIGWQIPPKVDLDTVDGFVRHNLASNIENKNTPVKTKLFVPKKSKGTSQTQKFIWSEQLRHLSPWSNKHISNNSSNVNRKSNLRSSSKAFLKSSKKKILRLVSPKKENKERINFQIRKTPHRNIGIQTSRDDISHAHPCQSYEPSCTQQSPPGSYHSPVQSSHLQSTSSTSQSQNTTPNGIVSTQTHFDFSRTVHSPPKKAPRSSQRRLNFPLNCSVTCNVDEDVDLKSAHAKEKKTYRSYNMELEQDVSISKISYILSNIRAKLEASDEHALRTFRETERRQPCPSGLDCLDGHRGVRQETEVEIHGGLEQDAHHNDPIYSEIEEDSFHIAERPDLDNHTAIQHLNVVHNPEILYATVNKSNKRKTNEQMVDKLTLPVEQRTQQPPSALGKILQDSLKNKKITTHITPLPTLPEPSESETYPYSSPTSLIGQLAHCQSLNNVRVMEHNSPPKRQRNLSKSDLSLHRSDIFLENLCKSELIINDGAGELQHLGKIHNDKTNQSYISMTQPKPNDQLNTSSDSYHELPHNDTVSYEMPNDVDRTAESIDADDSTTAGSNLRLNRIAPPSSDNQSTPKKQSFTTKGDPSRGEVENRDVIPNTNHSNSVNLCVSCPNTPHKLNDALKLSQVQASHSQSLNAVTDQENGKSSNSVSNGTLAKYKCFKNVLRKSFRKGKQFINSGRKRLSISLGFPASNTVGNETLARSTQSTIGSNLELEALFSLNESTSVSEQLAQTVSICRKLPDLEISTEMVEAERLLLFSALRREKCHSSTASKNQTMSQQPKMRFFIDEMFLPIRADVNQDIFFNYFYIVTFECGGIIKSTQSAECQNGSAVFRDCGIEYILCSEMGTNDGTHGQQHAVRCNVFMLRLRKVSTLGLEPKNRKTPEPFTSSPSSSLSSTASSFSVNSIISRFRLHASFTLDSSDFVPFEYVPQETNNSDRICVRSSGYCHIPLIPQTKTTNLSRELKLKGRAEVRFPKRSFAGFLNVEDPHSQHNWNRRWCTLDGIYLHVWQNVNNLNESPLISLDLRDNKTNVRLPLTIAPRELCARPRSFCLECTIRKADEHISTATIFFATESQDDLDDWLKILNDVLYFIVTWLS